MYPDLNEKQQSILMYITEELKTKGYPPSVREICLAVGLKSTSTVHSYLNQLEELGYIRRDSSKTRAIEIIRSEHTSEEDPIQERVTQIPLIGEITAGSPILAVECIEEMVPLPLNWFNNGSYFILKVKGDSMIEAGILDKDLIVFEQTSYAKNGDIVAALIDEEYATVKRFFKEEDGRIRLQPENQFYEPIYPDTVSILGVIKGLMRHY